MTCQEAEPLDEHVKCTCNTDCGEFQLSRKKEKSSNDQDTYNKVRSKQEDQRTEHHGKTYHEGKPLNEQDTYNEVRSKQKDSCNDKKAGSRREEKPSNEQKAYNECVASQEGKLLDEQDRSCPQEKFNDKDQRTKHYAKICQKEKFLEEQSVCGCCSACQDEELPDEKVFINVPQTQAQAGTLESTTKPPDMSIIKNHSQPESYTLALGRRGTIVKTQESCKEMSKHFDNSSKGNKQGDTVLQTLESSAPQPSKPRDVSPPMDTANASVSRTYDNI